MEFIEIETIKTKVIKKNEGFKPEKPTEEDILHFLSNMVGNLYNLGNLSDNIALKQSLQHGIIDLAKNINYFKKAQEKK